MIVSLDIHKHSRTRAPWALPSPARAKGALALSLDKERDLIWSL